MRKGTVVAFLTLGTLTSVAIAQGDCRPGESAAICAMRQGTEKADEIMKPKSGSGERSIFDGLLTDCTATDKSCERQRRERAGDQSCNAFGCR